MIEFRAVCRGLLYKLGVGDEPATWYMPVHPAVTVIRIFTYDVC